MPVTSTKAIVDKISTEIMSYLTERPDAKDTLEGIIQWWLLERNIIVQTGKVKEALTELVNRGLVIQRMGRDSQISYCINQSKYREI